MFPYDVQQIVFRDHLLIWALLGSLSFSPLLLMEVRRVEELWWQDGAGGFHPVYNLQEQPLVVVVEKSDGRSSVSQPTCPANLDGKKFWETLSHLLSYLSEIHFLFLVFGSVFEPEHLKFFFKLP